MANDGTDYTLRWWSQFLYDKLEKSCLVKLGQGGTGAYFDTEQ